MQSVAFAVFRDQAQSEGYNEVLERIWDSNQIVHEHSHPFAVRALVVAGEMWLTCGAETRHLRPGDRFELAPHQPHAERYGPEGATFWAARRHA